MKIIVTLFFAAALAAQQPQIDNAKLETRALAGSLAAEFSQLGAGTYWVGWSEPIIPGQHNEVCSWNRGNYQESARTIGAPVRLEGETALVILVRVENGQVDELKVSSPDCHLDAGGTSFYWLSNVPPAESTAWLKSQADGRRGDSAIMLISLHRDAAADRALDDLSAATQPVEIRTRVASRLANARGAHGMAMMKRMLASDPDPEVRSRVVGALSQSRDPQAMALVIEAARNDAEQSVRERAVWALARIPDGAGVPALIDLAKSPKDPNVRKRAMQQLGQSKDPRALDFFARVLKP